MPKLSTRAVLVSRWFAFVTIIGVTPGLMAQDNDSTPAVAGSPAAALEAAARTITEAEVVRHVIAFTPAGAPDSLRHTGDTGSYAQDRRERAATYIAEVWRQLGLIPAFRSSGDAVPGPWVQRALAPGQRRVSYAATELILKTSGTRGRPAIWNEAGTEVGLGWVASINFADAVHFVPEAGRPVLRETLIRRPLSLFDPNDVLIGSSRTLLVAGPHTAADLRGLREKFEHAVVFYVPPAGLDSAGRLAVLAELYGASRGVIVVSDADSATFVRELQAAHHAPVTVVEHYMLEKIAARRTWPWVVAVRRAAVTPRFWVGAGIEPAELWTLTTPLVRELPGTEGWLSVELEKLPTADSAAVTATPGGRVADSTGAVEAEPSSAEYPYVLGFLEGVDSVLKRQTVVITASLGARADQAAALAGLVALARAFGQPEARPSRSILFVAAGGGPPDYAGSWLVADEAVNSQRVVAALTLEPSAAPAGDTLVIDGLSDVTLPRSPAWIAATHPELGLRVVDTGTVFRPATAALALAANLAPGIRVSVGAPGATTGSEAAVRALRFVWYLAAALAAEPSVPRWTAAGRQRYLEVWR